MSDFGDHYTIGIDLGGTNLRVAAISETGFELHRLSLPARYQSGPAYVMDRMADAVLETMQEVGQTPRGIGIGVPGFIDSANGIVVNAANLAGFLEYPVRRELEQRLNSRVFLDNDANAAALGEMWMGAGQSVRDLILITLGTGVGGGIVQDRRVLSGSRGLAGEIGHISVYPDGHPCLCGNTGCLECYSSATAVVRMASEAGLPPGLTSAQVHQLAMNGNLEAAGVFQRMGRALGIAISNLIAILDVPLVLLSGGPLPAWDFFAPAMLAEVRQRSWTYRQYGVRIERAVLGSDAGLFGAAYLPVEAMLSQAARRLESAVGVG